MDETCETPKGGKTHVDENLETPCGKKAHVYENWETPKGKRHRWSGIGRPVGKYTGGVELGDI